MTKWLARGLVLIIILLSLFVTSLNKYIKAMVIINNLPTVQREKARADFTGIDSRGAERGILAGSCLGACGCGLVRG